MLNEYINAFFLSKTTDSAAIFLKVIYSFFEKPLPDEYHPWNMLLSPTNTAYWDESSDKAGALGYDGGISMK